MIEIHFLFQKGGPGSNNAGGAGAGSGNFYQGFQNRLKPFIWNIFFNLDKESMMAKVVSYFKLVHTKSERKCIWVKKPAGSKFAIIEHYSSMYILIFVIHSFTYDAFLLISHHDWQVILILFWQIFTKFKIWSRLISG